MDDHPTARASALPSAPASPSTTASSVVVLALTALCVIDLCLFKTCTDLDIWARLAVGELAVTIQGIPYQDPFSYTATKPWIDHEWGSGLLFYAAARVAGQHGLLLLRMLFFFLTVLLVHAVIRLRLCGLPAPGSAPPPSPAPPSSLLFHLFLAWGLLHAFVVTVRSQIFTYALFALWMLLLERARRGRVRGLLLLPLTALFWTNVHGGVLAGLGLIALYAAGELLGRRPWRPFFLAGAAAGLATLATPYGVRYWLYLIEAVTLPRTYITEWQPPDLFGPLLSRLDLKLFLVATLLLFARERLRRRPLDPTELLVLAVTCFLALRRIRHIPFFVIASAPFLYAAGRRALADMAASSPSPAAAPTAFAPAPSPSPAAAGEGWGEGRSEPPTPPAPAPCRAACFLLAPPRRGLLALRACALFVGLTLALSLPWRVAVPRTWLPVDGIQFIAENRLSGHLLVPFDWGSFALWMLHPQCQVAMDGRYEELYDETTFWLVQAFSWGRPGWERALETWRHDLALVPAHSQTCRNLATRPDWVRLWGDDMSEVWVPAASPAATAPPPGGWRLPDPARRAPDPFRPFR
ncbi:MAG: hypothetical protein HZA54_00595 [Planctomycetes bacterium]|nr:hypothetical protein [Planctomycetota bacterium]